MVVLLKHNQAAKLSEVACSVRNLPNGLLNHQISSAKCTKNLNFLSLGTSLIIFGKQTSKSSIWLTVFIKMSFSFTLWSSYILIMVIFEISHSINFLSLSHSLITSSSTPNPQTILSSLKEEAVVLQLQASVQGLKSTSSSHVCQTIIVMD